MDFNYSEVWCRMEHLYNFAVVVPMANEQADFQPFVSSLIAVLDALGSGKVYFVVDGVSQDETLDLCIGLSLRDDRFVTVWAPENRNVVDAYLRGYREALKNDHEFVIEMDAGMSHNPNALPLFLEALSEGNECVFGSRFISGGMIDDSRWNRIFLSKAGTLLSNCLLGSKLNDMTSGYQGFHRTVVEKFVQVRLLSTGHFYQTELRYLLRKYRQIEIPIHYRAPSPSVSRKSIINSFFVLFYYFFLRLRFQSPVIE